MLLQDRYDPAINTIRARQQRNFIATLLLSQGVPMLLHGDELGRTQQGNNNGYAQDNELTWIDWENVDQPLSSSPPLWPDCAAITRPSAAADSSTAARCAWRSASSAATSRGCVPTAR